MKKANMLIVIHETDLSDNEQIVIGVASSVEKAEDLISKYYGEFKEVSFNDIRDSRLEYSKIIEVADSHSETEKWNYKLLLEWFELDEI